MIFRLATVTDLPALLDVQEAGAVAALGHIFPQDRYPFPRQALLERWTAELGDPAVRVYVATDDANLVNGFAASRGGELLHFGTAVDTWGTGLARQLHDALVDAMAETSPSGAGYLASVSLKRTAELGGSTRNSAGSRQVSAPRRPSSRIQS
ncbi:MAG: GNAT family N-acetyltransferase [Acidimicrobiales bacterium]